MIWPGILRVFSKKSLTAFSRPPEEAPRTGHSFTDLLERRKARSLSGLLKELADRDDGGLALIGILAILFSIMLSTFFTSSSPSSFLKSNRVSIRSVFLMTFFFDVLDLSYYRVTALSANIFIACTKMTVA